MKILGIETSCDETAGAVVEDGTKILSNVVSSSLPLHAKTGGIIPEVAAREQAKALIPVIAAALRESGTGYQESAQSKFPTISSRPQIPRIDAIAVTFGPGLLGSLLVGVEAAKSLSYVWDKPLIPVNHLIAHLYAPWLENSNPPKFPLIALIVSGGHTELFFVPGHGRWRHLGGTRDDAAGEAFDKMARVLGLGYPGGPAIEKAAAAGDPTKFNLPKPLITSLNYDFSFSGLKTAVVNLVNQFNRPKTEKFKANLAAAIQEAIVEVLVKKTLRAAKEFKAPSIVLGGGVAANRYLQKRFLSEFTGQVYFSSPKLSLDNAAPVAAAAYFNPKKFNWKSVTVNPTILI